jgi:DNA polymerase-3 subunit delta
VSELKPAYLVWGDDESKLESWRRRLRKRAQAEGPSADLQVLKDEKLTADATAEALESLTLSVGRRYVLADGVERWKDRDVAPVESALAALPPETVVVFIAAGKPPTRLVQAVKKCGGEVHTCEAPKPAAYPRWVVERGRELGLALTRDAAQALVERVGHNQQRLRRPRW